MFLFGTNKMNYDELLAAAATDAGTNVYTARKVIDAVTDTIVQKVKQGGTVTIANLGVFGVTKKKQRMRFNVRTRALYVSPAKFSMKFTPRKKHMTL